MGNTGRSLDTESATSEGTIPFAVDGETFQTWFKVIGDLSNCTRRPLVVLHGGPGLSHDYMVALGDLAQVSIPVILYDQIGNGRSTRLTAKDVSFWQIDLFVDELVNLLAHLGVQDEFDVLGHSWGGILGLEFLLRRAPRGLKHLVLANSLASMALWDTSEAQLVARFPQDVQEDLQMEKTDRVRFRAALDKFYAVHAVAVTPMPLEFTRSLDFQLGEDGDSTVSTAM